MSSPVETLRVAVRDLWAMHRDYGRHESLGSAASASELHLLHLVDTAAPARVSRLAACSGVDVSVVSRQVSQLAAQGLVAKLADPDDGRSQLVQLSPAGRRLLRDWRSVTRRRWSEALRHWSDDELLHLADALGRLRSDLGAAGLVHAPPADRTPSPEENTTG